MLPLFISWLVGVVSGWFANLLFHKYQEWRKRKSKTDYFASTWVEGKMRFEGQTSTDTVDVGEIARKVLGIKDEESK